MEIDYNVRRLSVKNVVDLLEEEFEDVEREYEGQIHQDFDKGTDAYSDNNICPEEDDEEPIVSQESQRTVSTSDSASEKLFDVDKSVEDEKEETVINDFVTKKCCCLLGKGNTACS